MRMPVFCDYHSHNFRCKHASGEVIDYAQKAAELGMTEFGASDHIPLSSQLMQGPRMTISDFDSYRDAVFFARDKLKGSIDVLYGVEADYEGEIQTWRDCDQLVGREDFDYVIGSVHVFHSASLPGAVWDVLRTVSGSEREELTVRYFNLIGEMAKTKTYDIVGHLDGSHRHMGWDKNPEGKVEVAILKSLDAVMESKMSVEINTSGFRYGIGMQFPNWWIIGKLVERGIPVMINSDAHHPDSVGQKFDEVVAKLIEYTGVKQATYRKRKISEVSVPSVVSQVPVDL